MVGGWWLVINHAQHTRLIVDTQQPYGKIKD